MRNRLWKHFREWGIYVVLIAAILYFFAPRNWFQFGVGSERSRPAVQDFALRRFEGVGSWSPKSARGKVVLINYWATWCGPCKFETPGLVNLSNEFAGKRVEFVGVTMDEDLTPVPEFIKEYKIHYPILLPGFDPNLGDGDFRLPTTFLFDKRGRLAKKYEGFVLESTLRADINSLLSE